MVWTVQPSKIAHHIECLTRDDDGRFIGYVIQFNSNEPTYAWTEHKRIGAITGVGAAKDIVEEWIGKVER